MAKFLLLQVGRTFEQLSRVRGDYDVWFRAALGVEEQDLEVVKVAFGEPLPSHHGYAGVVVTGSAAMVTDRESWSEATAAYLLEGFARSVPTLGVCYGHQLIAHALGGRVDDNPKGRTVGTVELVLSEDARTDLLFSSLPERALVQASHRQSVLALPSEAVVLGASPTDSHYAYRVGRCAWGVQFHPEFDAEIARSYIELRREVIAAEGGDPDGLLARVREGELGGRLLRKFVALAQG